MLATGRDRNKVAVAAVTRKRFIPITLMSERIDYQNIYKG
jgi:hypothetical protein